MKCNIAPVGWKCKRELGHSGPCAAIKLKEIDQVCPRVRCGTFAWDMEDRMWNCGRCRRMMIDRDSSKWWEFKFWIVRKLRKVNFRRIK